MIIDGNGRVAALLDWGHALLAPREHEGINSWGFEGLRRVDADLALARPFCAA
ncbi:hypothetical protein ACXJJ3_01260 [Kribbella sp. WER1]